MILHHDVDNFNATVLQASRFYGIEQEIIVKDYYVTLILAKLVKQNPDVVFKGGTSLSKCYNLIKRFSEDIDLTLYLREDNKPTQSIIKQSNKSIVHVIDELGLFLVNASEIKSGRKFNQYYVQYSIAEGTDVLKDHILIENTLLTKAYPTVRLPVKCMVREYLVGNGYEDIATQYELEPFEIFVQDISRTFVDKVFALCDYYLSDNFQSHSRHIYDLYKINSEIEIESLPELIRSVRKERATNRTCISADSKHNINEILTQIIKSRCYESDYKNTTMKLLYEEVDYETAVVAIEEIASSNIF